MSVGSKFESGLHLLANPLSNADVTYILSMLALVIFTLKWLMQNVMQQNDMENMLIEKNCFKRFLHSCKL